MAVQATAGQRPSRAVFWNDPRVRSIFFQVVVVALVVGLIAYLVNNTLVNLRERAIATGFDFLDREAAFEIAETPIPYSPADTYGRAFLVGLLNTLQVAFIGIILATILGTIIGIARLSTNWLIRKLSMVYVEVIRNVPLLLQLIFWWKALLESAPAPRQAWQPLPGVFLSNRGLFLPWPVYDPVHLWMLVALVVAVGATFIVVTWAKRRQMATGQQFPVFTTGLALIIGLPLLAFLAGGAPSVFEFPELRGFNYTGGHAITPEFTALVVGLVVYTAAFIAEIVRGGIQAVNWGQTEAAMALGLKRGMVLRLVVLPQALRVIVPPLTSQYLNLTKNSSLAVAIGYPELVSIMNTTLNQTGQAVEGIALVMAVYLTISLSISLFMNWYNRHIALVER